MTAPHGGTPRHGAERVLRFGRDSGLIGIFTEAGGPPNGSDGLPRPAVVFLDSGILHRVGACRWHVRLARALSTEGFACLRFDFAGIGDSAQRRDALPFEASAVLETGEAIDRVLRITGAEHVVLMGLCSGADIAHETALQDRRVVGLHLIDAWSYRTMGFYVHHYAPRLLRGAVWRNAWRVRIASLRTAMQRGSRAPVADAPLHDESYELPTYTRVFPPRDRIAADLRHLVERDVRLRFVWTGGLPDHNHLGQYASHFRDVDFGDVLEEDYLPNADHIITGLDDQRTVTRRAVEWARRHWPARNRPREPLATDPFVRPGPTAQPVGPVPSRSTIET